MLLSIVFHLEPARPAAIPVDQARALESVFMEWIRAADAEYAGELHAAQDKDFTISNLRGAKENQKREALLLADAPLTWRVTTFSPRLSALVSGLLREPGPPQSIHLENSDCTLNVRGVELEAPGGFSAPSSYEEIVQKVLLAPHSPEANLEVRFESPTSFRQDGRMLLFPLAENVFDSWLRRWNAFSPVKLPEETRAFAGQWAAVSRYTLQTARVAGDGAWELGFTGQCRYRILSNDPYWMRVLHALASFSFYCGTGRKTARGMGQTRLISHGPA